MTTTIVIASHIAAPAEKVWEEVQTTRLLHHVTRPILSFRPIEPPTWPDRWEEREYLAELLLFGLLPIGRQVLGISKPPPEGDQRFVRDNGRSGLIKRWDHLITIMPEGEGTHYQDRLHLDAGLLTPFVALFARIFYRHRQSRWRELAANGFSYEGTS